MPLIRHSGSIKSWCKKRQKKHCRSGFPKPFFNIYIYFFFFSFFLVHYVSQSYHLFPAWHADIAIWLVLTWAHLSPSLSLYLSPLSHHTKTYPYTQIFLPAGQDVAVVPWSLLLLLLILPCLSAAYLWHKWTSYKSLQAPNKRHKFAPSSYCIKAADKYSRNWQRVQIHINHPHYTTVLQSFGCEPFSLARIWEVGGIVNGMRSHLRGKLVCKL